jgi:hypothetical protein
MATNTSTHHVASTPHLTNKQHHTVLSPGPGSYTEQKQLLLDERNRLVEAQAFVRKQRESLEERTSQLKTARKHWKADVLAAKAQGLAASSRKGQLLHKVKEVLEKQALGLRMDEALLADSEQWLETKEQRLLKLEEQMDEKSSLSAAALGIPKGSSGMDVSATSIDTQVLMTSFFKPSPVPSSLLLPATAAVGPQHRRNDTNNASTTPRPLPVFADPTGGAPSSRSISPMLTQALERIEARLDKVTSFMKNSSASANGRGATSSAASGVADGHHYHHHQTTSSGAVVNDHHATRPSSRSQRAATSLGHKRKQVDFAPTLRPFADAWSELAAPSN